MVALVSRLWPFVRHLQSSVRLAVLQALDKILCRDQLGDVMTVRYHIR